MKVGILGAGHAGIKAAETLRAKGADVVLFSKENTLPYFRPRIIALAFGQAEPEAIQMHPASWYADKGIDLRLNQAAIRVNKDPLSVTTASTTESFDVIIMAVGAGPFVPPLTSTPLDRVIPLWNQENATHIRSLATPGARLAIIGGGILGVEAALRATEAGLKVTIIERLPRLQPMQFDQTASAALRRSLESRGITVLVDCSVQSIEQQQDELLLVTEGNRRLTMDSVVISVGSRRMLDLADSIPLKTERGILVDEYLRTSESNIWAAGDIIEFPGLNRCSAADASMQGKTAAENILADAAGTPLQAYVPTSAAVHYKLESFELHSIGRVAGAEDQEVIMDQTDDTCRVKILHNGKLVGLQMIGTKLDFNTISSELT